MASQEKTPPPLPFSDRDFMYRSLANAVQRIIGEIQTSNGSSLLNYRELEDALQDLSKDLAAVHGGIDMIRLAPSAPDEEAIGDVIDEKLIELHQRFDRLEKRFDTVDREIALTAKEATVSTALGTQSRLLETTVTLLAERRERNARRPPKVIVRTHEVSRHDIVSEEPDNVIPIRQARRSPLRVLAAAATAFAAALCLSGMPYAGDTPPMDCHRATDKGEDVYDCGSGHLWVATKIVSNPDGGVDLDLKPYGK